MGNRERLTLSCKICMKHTSICHPPGRWLSETGTTSATWDSPYVAKGSVGTGGARWWVRAWDDAILLALALPEKQM
jgi:hypothetical protein